MRTRMLFALVSAALPLSSLADTEPKPLPPIDISVVVPAPIEKVWNAFATTEGVKAWMVKQADLDTRIGGIWRTKYGADGHLGDEGTIENEVLAYDPGRMFCIRISKVPKGFPFMNVYRDMWTVVYFDPAPGGKTKVTLRGHGFKDTPESKQFRAFFEMGDKETLNELVKHFRGRTKD